MDDRPEYFEKKTETYSVNRLEVALVWLSGFAFGAITEAVILVAANWFLG